ncbi:MAG: hypothetical protein ACRDRL_26730 [Sciscionella sp.]
MSTARASRLQQANDQWACAQSPDWCQYGTTKRMNVRDVLDDVYAALVEVAGANRQ